MSKMIDMPDNEAFEYMMYLNKNKGEEAAKNFFNRYIVSNPTKTVVTGGNNGNGIPWVAKGITNGSLWKHDIYQIVVEVTDENSLKGGVKFKCVQGNANYSSEMLAKFNEITSFSGFNKLIGNPKAALEHAHWHCIRQGQSTTRANKGYIATIGDTIRTSYSRNGYKAS